MLLEIFTTALPGLKSIVAGHEVGDYGLLLNGNPTKPGQAAISALACEITATLKLQEKQQETMGKLLESSLTQWFQEMVLKSEKVATSKLQLTLQSIANVIE